MNLSTSIDLTGLLRKMDLVAENAKSLDGALRQFSGIKRGRVQDIFDQGGKDWPALDPDTIAHRQAKSTAVLENKLKRELKRAEKTYERAGEKFKKFEQANSLGAEIAKKLRAPNQNAVLRRLTNLAEFRRLRAGGSAASTLFEGKNAGKQQAKLGERMGRAAEKASKNMLGGIARSIMAEVSKGTLTISSRIPWAGVHNRGGAAGHGAKIPARPFLFWDQADIEVLGAVIRSWLLHGQ